jgi:hypothetical protein
MSHHRRPARRPIAERLSRQYTGDGFSSILLLEMKDGAVANRTLAHVKQLSTEAYTFLAPRSAEEYAMAVDSLTMATGTDLLATYLRDNATASTAGSGIEMTVNLVCSDQDHSQRFETARHITEILDNVNYVTVTAQPKKILRIFIFNV